MRNPLLYGFQFGKWSTNGGFSRSILVYQRVTSWIWDGNEGIHPAHRGQLVPGEFAKPFPFSAVVGWVPGSQTSSMAWIFREWRWLHFKFHDNVWGWLKSHHFFFGGVPIVFCSNPCPRIYHLHDQICGPLCQHKKAHARWCPIVSEVGFQEGWPGRMAYRIILYI